MTSIQPEQIFIHSAIMGAAPPYRPEDQLEFLALYLSIAVKLRLYGKAVAANLHASAFRKAVRQLNAYRVSTQRDSEFMANAETWKLSGLGAMDCTEVDALSPAILGILCSDNPEDLSAAFNAMRRYALAVDPTLSPPCVEEPAPKGVSVGIPSTLLSIHRMEIERNLPMHAAPAISKLSQQLDVSGQEDARNRKNNAALLVLCFGRNAWATAERIYRTELSDSRLTYVISRFPISLSSIIRCSQDFWAELAAGNLSAQITAHASDAADVIAGSEIIPLLQMLKGLSHGSIVQQGFDPADTKCGQDIAEPSHPMEPDASSLESENAGLKMSLSQARDELAAAQAAALQDRSRADTLCEQVSALNGKVSALAGQVKDLTQKLLDSKKLSEEYNNRLFDAYEETGIFFDTNEEDDSDSQVSGLQGRLGNETVQALRSKRVLIAGGHASTHNNLREIFPDWEYIADCRNVPRNTATKLDGIVIITSYCSHSCYKSAQRLSKSIGVQLINCPKNSAYSVCERVNFFLG